MKKIIVNMAFILSFICFVCLISLLFYDDFVQAFSDDNLFPKNKSLGLSECQEWTEEVRQFDVQKGNEAIEVPVLMYHRIIEEKKIVSEHLTDDLHLKKTIIPKSNFLEQMQFLHEENYTTLTAKEFLMFMEGRLKVPKKSVLLTFDDGYKDNYTEVYPILKKYDFKALNFIITGAITTHRKTYKSEKHQYFSLDELNKSCDVFDFQSHTYNFHKRTTEGTPYLIHKNRKEISNDLAYSLKNLEGRNHAFAYPFGAYDKKTIKALKKLGFKMAFTTNYKNAKPGMAMYEIPRKEVFPEDSLIDFKNKIND
ncbi:polysaccharide deacetylase family protein [Pseudalkalibacillus sp. Hm43]|uniref:polysaccharide deacetylase family protein n=1 Tax=Pseudalkalibacillus sp. Hm43 TaxID=3450742 RepID=UPI003F41D156